MTTAPFIHLASDHPRALNVLGEKITVLASGEVTGGYEIFIQKGDAGVGPPPHAHDWDESFYVVRGEIEFGIGTMSRVCGPGALIHVPTGVSHWFRFRSEGEMLSITSRLGASTFFTDVDRVSPNGAVDMDRTVAVALNHGLTFRDAV